MTRADKESLAAERARSVASVEFIVGYSFSNSHLLAQALTHPSAVENERTSQSYERLEFLGDAILGAVIALFAYERFPALDEGLLTRIKVHLVSGESLSNIALDLGLDKHIILGKSEKQASSRGRTAALENVFEAIIGALFLDAGFERTKQVIRDIFADQLAAIDIEDLEDPKSKLQALTQKKVGLIPTYKLLEQTGPPHQPCFTVQILIGDKAVAQGSGSSKKKAEAEAAKEALKALE